MPKEYFQIEDCVTLADVPERGKIHLIGVCGVAMGQLAVALAEAGYIVSGSDKEFYPPMGDLLAESAVELKKGYNADNVPLDADLVVVGNAVSYGHDEVAVVEEQGLPYTCFPKVLSELVIADKTSIVACGTHGKSTTSAMIAKVLKDAGRDPSYFIGGVVEGLPNSLAATNGKFSVVEGDEYDCAFFAKVPKFTFYSPDICIINAVEFDHADIYADLEAVSWEFTKLVAGLSRKTTAVCCFDFPHLRNLIYKWRNTCDCKIVTFGEHSDADFCISDRTQSGFLQTFKLSSDHLPEKEVRVSIQMAGDYNARNATATLIASITAGLDVDVVLEQLKNFERVKRRQEVRFDGNGISVIEDFAHHPTAVNASISAVRSAFPEKKLWAVFEPRSNTSRRKIFQDDYIAAFRNADRAILSEVKARSIDSGKELLDVNALAGQISDQGTPTIALAEPDGIASHLATEVGSNDVILIMSNGSFGGLVDNLLGKLK